MSSCLKLFDRKDKPILFNVINNIRLDKPSGYMDSYFTLSTAYRIDENNTGI